MINVVKCLPCDAAFGMSDIQGHFEEKHFGAKNSATMAMRAKESVLGREQNDVATMPF